MNTAAKPEEHPSFPGVVFHFGAERLMSFTPHGAWNVRSVATLVRYIEEQEDRLGHPFNRFTNTSHVSAIDLDHDFIYDIALHRRSSYAERAPIKSAFYVSNPEAARVIGVHASVNLHEPLQVKVFDDLDSAARWLGVRRRLVEI